MRIDGQRRSENIRDLGRGGGGGVGAAALFGLFRLLGFRGMIIAALVLGVVYFFNPLGLRDAIFGGVAGGAGQSQSAAQSTCSASQTNAQACDFSSAVLASTEDVWRAQFQQGRILNYGVQPGAYRDPTLSFFSDSVDTGCGRAPSSVGPFYCPADSNLYIDPTFYQVMATRLNAPGDFAQAYVIAHEVGHHVQNLIGATRHSIPGESQNQTSVRVELQADCLAGVWGHTARANLAIDDADLREALNAAHAIGDDTLGAREQQYTHGTSAQRVRWFRRGFDTGDARQCDTFAVRDYRQL